MRHEDFLCNESCEEVIVFTVEIAVDGHGVDLVKHCTSEFRSTIECVEPGCNGGVGAPPLHGYYF